LIDRLPLLSGKSVDRLRQLHVSIGHPSGVMAGEAEIDPIPDARELRMVIGFLGI
jgi:hypothetical protein